MRAGDPEAAGPRADASGRRDRAALGRAIRGISSAPDLPRAAAIVAEQAAWLLHADVAMVVRDDGAVARVVAAAGSAAPQAEQEVSVSGALSEALRGGRAAALRVSGSAEAACPIDRDGAPWGAIAISGPSARTPRRAQERLAPFADLVSLAAATHEDRSRLASLAGTDPLTGLGNRRTFDALLAAEAERAARHDDLLSLVLLDIDHFKGVNDRFGHQQGDRVLMEVGRRLVAIARRGEAIARIGGEEFAWILPRTGAEGSEAAAARALSAIADAPFEGVGRLTLSAGVCDLGAAGSADEMVAAADRMLYRAKADGRNAVRRFVPAPELAASA
jgi:diguanylate cyclase (GGDEF)-like protein